jgi:alcohol dehydrogenase
VFAQERKPNVFKAKWSESLSDEEDALDFNALQVVRPMIERMPVEQAPEEYAKMMRNESRFRMVAVHYISPHSFHSVLSSNGMRA